MTNDPLVFAAISDLAGKMRGKAFPKSETEKRVARGVGWVPTNALITCFDRNSRDDFNFPAQVHQESSIRNVRDFDAFQRANFLYDPLSMLDVCGLHRQVTRDGSVGAVDDINRSDRSTGITNRRGDFPKPSRQVTITKTNRDTVSGAVVAHCSTISISDNPFREV